MICSETSKPQLTEQCVYVSHLFFCCKGPQITLTNTFLFPPLKPMCDQASFKTNTCSDATNVVGDSPTSHEKYPVVFATQNAVHYSLKKHSFLQPQNRWKCWQTSLKKHLVLTTHTLLEMFPSHFKKVLGWKCAHGLSKKNTKFCRFYNRFKCPQISSKIPSLMPQERMEICPHLLKNTLFCSN